LLERGLVEMNERDRALELVAWIGVRQPVVEAREQDRQVVVAKYLAIEVVASQLAAGQDHQPTALGESRASVRAEHLLLLVRDRRDLGVVIDELPQVEELDAVVAEVLRGIEQILEYPALEIGIDRGRQRGSRDTALSELLEPVHAEREERRATQCTH